MKVGALFCLNFDVSNPYILATGGAQGISSLSPSSFVCVRQLITPSLLLADVLAVWDITENATVNKYVTAGEYARSVAEAKAAGKAPPPPPAPTPAPAPAAAASAAAASPAAAPAKKSKSSDSKSKAKKK